MGVTISGDNISIPGQASISIAPTSASHSVRRADAGRLRSYVSALDLNAAAPLDLTALVVGSVKWIPVRAFLCNATADIHLATLGIYSAVAAGGIEIVVPEALTNLTASGKFYVLTLAALTDPIGVNTVYPRLTVASGVAGTADLVMEYDVLDDL